MAVDKFITKENISSIVVGVRNILGNAENNAYYSDNSNIGFPYWSGNLGEKIYQLSSTTLPLNTAHSGYDSTWFNNNLSTQARSLSVVESVVFTNDNDYVAIYANGSSGTLKGNVAWTSSTYQITRGLRNSVVSGTIHGWTASSFYYRIWRATYSLNG